MNNQEGYDFVRDYFEELFGKRNINALDVFLDEDYFDEDIGVAGIDHIQNSREYLLRLFQENPSIGVDVTAAIAQDNVISAFLEWYVTENEGKHVIRKGVANFVLNKGKIIRRHTFVYFEE